MAYKASEKGITAKRSSFALVVCAEDDEDVFDCDDEA